MMLHGAVQTNDANDPNQVDLICPDGAMAQKRVSYPDEDGNHKTIKLQLRLLFLCFYERKLDDRNTRKLGGY